MDNQPEQISSSQEKIKNAKAAFYAVLKKQAYSLLFYAHSIMAQCEFVYTTVC